jgi:hypothetical protein
MKGNFSCPQTLEISQNREIISGRVGLQDHGDTTSLPLSGQSTFSRICLASSFVPACRQCRGKMVTEVVSSAVGPTLPLALAKAKTWLCGIVILAPPAGDRQTPSLALKPPSIEKSLPRQKPDSCPTRKETNAATSSIVPTRPIACDLPNPAIVSSMLLPSGAKERAENSSIGVRTEPGDTELTRTPSFAQSTAIALVSAWIAPLDVAYPSTLFWFICPCTEAKFTIAALPRAFSRG